jgi:hypothetical protein
MDPLLGRLETYRAAQAAASAKAATPAQPSGAPSGGGGATGSGGGDAGDGRVPEHLLERARLARERKAAQAAG